MSASVAVWISTRPQLRLEAQNSMKQAGAKKAPTPGSWKPGQSGNPGGRPRSALALCERIRERMNPDTLIDLAERVAADETLTPRDRILALSPLFQMGFVRVAQQIDARISQTTASEQSFDGWSVERLRAVNDFIEATSADTTCPRDTSTDESTSNTAPIADDSTLSQTVDTEGTP